MARLAVELDRLRVVEAHALEQPRALEAVGPRDHVAALVEERRGVFPPDPQLERAELLAARDDASRDRRRLVERSLDVGRFLLGARLRLVLLRLDRAARRGHADGRRSEQHAQAEEDVLALLHGGDDSPRRKNFAGLEASARGQGT